jgi:hypothetical protein
VGRHLGLLFEGLGDDFLDLGVGNRPRCTGPGFVSESFEAVVEESLPPLADGDWVDVESGGDGVVFEILGAGQDDLGPGGGNERLKGTHPGAK